MALVAWATSNFGHPLLPIVSSSMSSKIAALHQPGGGVSSDRAGGVCGDSGTVRFERTLPDLAWRRL